MIDAKEHYGRMHEVPTIYKVRGLRTAEVQSFFSGIDLGNLFKRGEKTLEIGYGNGFLSADISREFGTTSFGVDVVEPPQVQQGVTFQMANAEELPFSTGSFNVVFSYFAFPYMPEKLHTII